MKTFTIRTKGLDSLLKNLNSYERNAADKIDNELSKAAFNVESDARSRAPQKLGQLTGGIHANTSVRYRKTVGVNSPIGAYLEFGTGAQVFRGAYSFTPAEKVFAREFYVSGKGRTRSFAYLFPAFHNEIPKLVGRLKRILFGR